MIYLPSINTRERNANVIEMKRNMKTNTGGKKLKNQYYMYSITYALHEGKIIEIILTAKTSKQYV